MFYNPRVTVIDSIPTIVYPSKGTEKVFSRNETGCVEGHISTVYDVNRSLFPGVSKFLIAIAWDHTLPDHENPDPMVDIWSYVDLDGESGAQVYQRTFRELKRDADVGEACENAFAMLGREADHRRGKSLHDYLQTRPKLPRRLRVGKDFYLIN